MTRRLPGIEGGQVAARLPLAKIGFGLEDGNLLGDRHDQKSVHGYPLSRLPAAIIPA
jgi:hypothetical protein